MNGHTKSQVLYQLFGSVYNGESALPYEVLFLQLLMKAKYYRLHLRKVNHQYAD
jgi:hypothetical protein